MYMERLMTSRFLILPTLADDELMSWFVFVIRLNDLFEAGLRQHLIKEGKVKIHQDVVNRLVASYHG